MSFDYDLITIGAGSGGVAASRRAASYGARVAICEDDRVGGTCVIRGCVPKKLLVMGSRFQDDFDDARGFGWDIGEAPPPTFDWARLVAAKDREVDRLNGVYLRMLREAGVTLETGRARLVDVHTVEIGGRRITAANVLVATGSHPVVPTMPGAELAITSNEALSLPKLPARAAIVGGGYIGVEFAGIFRSLGVDVTMILRGDAVLRGFDYDVRAALTTEMKRRGVKLRNETTIFELTRVDGGLRARLSDGDAIDVDVVLFATGRAPSTSGLGLEEAGVKVDAHGAIVVDDASRTAAPSVFAVGDCTNRKNLTPIAIAEGRAVAEALFNSKKIAIDYAFTPSAVFSQPPVGTVGYAEADAKAHFGDVDVYVSTFRPMRNVLAGRDERTMMKLVVARDSQRVVGCHVVGADAPEIVQGFAVALACGATKEQLDRTIGIHPTAAEELVTMREKRAAKG